MLAVFAFWGFLAALVAGNVQGQDYVSYGPEKLCAVMGGHYNGYSYVGGNGKEAGPKAKVPNCVGINLGLGD